MSTECSSGNRFYGRHGRMDAMEVSRPQHHVGCPEERTQRTKRAKTERKGIGRGGGHLENYVGIAVQTISPQILDGIRASKRVM